MEKAGESGGALGKDQLALLSARICGRTVAPRGDEEASCRAPVWRTLGRLRLSKQRPVGFLSSSPMTDRRTALGSRPSASQITANEKTYRRSPLVIHRSASPRTSPSADLKLWSASSSTASIRARMPDQGGAACVCVVVGISVVGISKEASATWAISFIEVFPYAWAAPRRCRRLAPRWGSYVSEWGPLCPACGQVNVFTTKLPSSITTVLIDTSGPREILAIQDGRTHKGRCALPVQRRSPSNRTLGYRRAVCRLGEGRSTRVTLCA